MEYDPRSIEKKWAETWKDNNAYKVSNDSDRPKYYVLDMFPYPSGAGLHVGHPLGYIGSDIVARYKRLRGFNVLHPMGFDSFGLPAEQYAMDTGQHPTVTTRQNIQRYREQLDNIGFSFDWSREVNTSQPSYYKWTQWIFLQLFKSYYDRNKQKASSIADLIGLFNAEGNINHPCPGDESIVFTSEGWHAFDHKQQQDILMHYRLAYCGYGEVNWCEALGTVLANDEVVNGVSERGGHPVVKKKLRQWYLRITEYADRLLQGLTQVDFSESMKEMQSNWIGKSYGANITWQVGNQDITVFTTRPDTIFGADFMVLAPELDIIQSITTDAQRAEVEAYITYVKSRSDRERQAEKKITGAFTGAYAIHPFTGRDVPVWISEYVLAGYGTGAIMAVPCGDERDHKFARHFDIPITNILGDAYNGTEANPSKDVPLANSEFLNGLLSKDAIEVILGRIEEKGIGARKVNYKMRDAAFSRQRYWGEPFPIVWKDGIAYPLDEDALPLELPKVDSYSPGPEGEGPLANIGDWTSRQLETNTMPGYAGSSWYFLRYMDPNNDAEFCSRKASDYWNQVDMYVGGTEHAVGHLLYSRMWTKALCDLGHIGFDEPFKKLVNQGMIQGSSRFVHRINGTDQYVSATLLDQEGRYEGRLVDTFHVDVSFVDGFELDTEAFRNWRPEYAHAGFILDDGKYICTGEVEKMSKSKYNVVNPDEIVEKYGADTFRLYEMFLGPLEQSKPWDTKGIEGVSRFLRKFWRLFFDEDQRLCVIHDEPTADEWKTLHKTIKKVSEDIENLSFNTCISQFMICVNDLQSARCNKIAILKELIILITPFAPHICEELWMLTGQSGSVLDAAFPSFNGAYLVENEIKMPVAINGKTRTDLVFDATADEDTIKAQVLADPVVRKWMEGKEPKKFIIVKGRMVNIVI